ncbi:MAG: hypothetical protein L6U61_03035 [Bacteroidales bacterium]|nr:MAG: hypothetical protein L6U61_03035 [Bacteroidales bacterium]
MCRVPAHCAALRVPGYGRVPSLRDDVCGDVGVARPLARSDSGSGVVAYLRHADSRGVSSPGTLRCAPLRVPGYGRVPSLCDDECGDVGVTRPLARSGCGGSTLASWDGYVGASRSDATFR